MVETSDVLSKLQAEQDWNMTAVFTDKEQIVAANKCTLLPEEVK
jgi:hypothetical protein